MIQLVSKSLSKETQDQLDALQVLVNTKPDFEEKAAEAKALWNKKGSPKERKAAFQEVKTTLTSMCVAVGICNYCEQNEANDIEHIHPKSFFPELAFTWDNYLLACKQCNTGHKLDKCYVLDIANTPVKLVRQEAPIVGATIAFINPRVENPNDFMMLNLKTFKFDVFEHLGIVAQRKAEKTLEILELNERDTLIEARETAFEFFYDRLRGLTQMLAADSNEAIEKLLAPHKVLDTTVSLEQNKEDIEANHKKAIEQHQHPSVWYAIKIVSSKTNAKWKALFEELPQALNW
jgi:uncharacterized protein (TIGR02646 family)